MSSANRSATGQLRYRQAFESDARLLAKIHEECFPNYWDSRSFTDFFAVENTQAMLVENTSGQGAGPVAMPVAMMVYRVMYEHADIITIAVLPAWRRRGIARELMKRAFAHAKALGARKIFLDVEEGNKAAMVLYEGMGFHQINRRKDYYKQKDGSFTDALVMTCELA